MPTAYTRLIRRTPDDLEVVVHRDCCSSGCDVWKTWSSPHSYEGIHYAEVDLIRSPLDRPIPSFFYAVPNYISTSQAAKRIGVAAL